VKYSFSVQFAETKSELEALANLRYRVFHKEFSSFGQSFDNINNMEWGSYDETCKHIICSVYTSEKRKAVIGALRIKLSKGKNYTFQASKEFNIDEILKLNEACCEVSRICIDQNYRNGLALFKMWQFLFKFLEINRINVLFGVGSFQGVDINLYKDSLLTIFENYVSAVTKKISSTQMQNTRFLAGKSFDRVKGMKNTPDVIKTYLRFGCKVAPEYFVDYEFNTIDLFCVLSLNTISEQKKNYLSKELFN